MLTVHATGRRSHKFGRIAYVEQTMNLEEAEKLVMRVLKEVRAPVVRRVWLADLANSDESAPRPCKTRCRPPTLF